MLLGLKQRIKRELEKLIGYNFNISELTYKSFRKEGLYAAKMSDDHSIIFHYGDTIGKKIAKDGDFNRQDVVKVVSTLKQRGRDLAGLDVLEVGANVGSQTLYLLLDSACRHIIALEPDPENVALLRLNVAANGFGDSVTIVGEAASDAAGELEFMVNPYNRGGSSVSQKRIASLGHPTICVPARTTDEILADLQREPTEIGLIWMDVEGHEVSVVKGMRRLLSTAHPPIFLEYNAPEHAPEDREFLMNQLFELYEHVLLFGEGFHPLEKESFQALNRRVDLLCL